MVFPKLPWRLFGQRVRHFSGTPGETSGIRHLQSPQLNKGLAFTLKERQLLGIHGLLAPAYRTMEDQVELCRLSVLRYQDPLNRYLYLTELGDRNERLFYRLLSENVETLMPIVYTPTVGLACQKFGLIYRRPRGLFISLNDKGHIYEVMKNWPEPHVRVICVTDGERILGLGDLGANGMGIPIGKLALCTALGGIKPNSCLPMMIDVGTNNRELLEDPLYVGLRRERIKGADYDAFVDEFVKAVVRRYGQNTLIQFEDFGNHNAFRFLDKYRGQYCVFNDDIQGTASVVLSGLLSCKRVTGKELKDNVYVFLGAGEAAIGIADLLTKAMEMDGLTTEMARSKIWMLDIHGLLARGRPEGDLGGHKSWYAKDHKPIKGLKEVVDLVKPTTLIGASAAAGAFTPEVLQAMAKNNEKPIIFALSNPTHKSECTAEQAYQHTEGRCIFASGSPFPPVKYKDKVFLPGQGNNAYVFPGVALGVITTGMYHVKEELFIVAAKTVAEAVSKEVIEEGSVYPKLSDIKEVSIRIAVKICQYAYDKGLASVYPEPQDKRMHITSQMYNYNYDASLPASWEWPPPIPVEKAMAPRRIFRESGPGNPPEPPPAGKKSQKAKEAKVAPPAPKGTTAAKQPTKKAK